MIPSRAGAALACVLLSAGCHGSLFDLSDGGATDDAAAGGNFYNPTIQHDLDANNCALAGPCHAGTAPMHLVAAPVDIASVKANYSQVLIRAQSDSGSLLLSKPLSGSDHMGIMPFAGTSDPTYQRWLTWIRAGDPFAPDGGT